MATSHQLTGRTMLPKITYKAARIVRLNELATMGWTLSDTTLKVPHATSPDGHTRLWFKAQAVHYTTVGYGARHDAKDARTLSYDLDYRHNDAAKMIVLASR